MSNPYLAYSGIYDRYTFNPINDDSILTIKIGLLPRRILCNKCSYLVLRAPIIIELIVGYHDYRFDRNKAKSYLKLSNINSVEETSIHIPSMCNFLDIKNLTLNLSSPKCDCFFFIITVL